MSDLRARLRNLRAVNRPRPEPRYEYDEDVSQFSQDSGSPLPLEELTEGELHETPLGNSYIVRKLHTHDHTHGDGILQQWLTQSLAGAAVFTKDRRLAGIDPRRCLFLDTETTGLSGSTGTLVFLVGIGFFTDDGFEVRQYFMRNPGEEPAMLHALRDLLEGHEAFVTFNGRSFDIPLLAMRYTLNRNPLRSDRWPNLDLLHPARRLWKRRLESCRLTSLETSILGVRRTGQDVPGYLIPQLYFDYVRSGDARQMLRVMYHNLNDVLSMVTLASHLCSIFTYPEADTMPQDDLLSLGRWYDSLTLLDLAETTYRAALKVAQRDRDRIQVLECLALLLKKQDRRVEAESLWQSLAELQPYDPAPRLELAKYHEWTTGDIPQAKRWTESALQAITSGPPTLMQRSILDDIRRRQERLARKSGS
jgi:uncharacterized protein YprB with RNaseH-like and TPR domain